MLLPARWIAGAVAVGIFVAPPFLPAQQERDVRGAALAAVWHALEHRRDRGDFMIATPDPSLTAWLIRETGGAPVPDEVRASCEAGA